MTNFVPQTSADMVFANSTTKNQISAILNGAYSFPETGITALCLYGTYGTGKTTYSHIFCKEFEQQKSGQQLAADPHFVSCQKTELIDTILRSCENMTKYHPWNESNYHYFIFDEVDNLTENAQKALKAFLNKSNIVCVLTINYLHKLDKGLLDRCVQINFNAANPKSIRNHVQHVLDSEGKHLGQDAIDEIVANSNGSWRAILPTARMLAQPLVPQPRPPIQVVK